VAAGNVTVVGEVDIMQRTVDLKMQYVTFVRKEAIFKQHATIDQ
jgi:hypothetical protein